MTAQLTMAVGVRRSTMRQLAASDRVSAAVGCRAGPRTAMMLTAGIGRNSRHQCPRASSRPGDTAARTCRHRRERPPWLPLTTLKAQSSRPWDIRRSAARRLRRSTGLLSAPSTSRSTRKVTVRTIKLARCPRQPEPARLTDRADGLSGYVLQVLMSGGGFVFGEWLIAQCRVQSGAVVPGDVFDDGSASGGSGRPGLVVGQFALDRAEEALGQGVVPALAGPAVRSRAATALASAAAGSSVRR